MIVSIKKPNEMKLAIIQSPAMTIPNTIWPFQKSLYIRMQAKSEEAHSAESMAAFRHLRT